MIDENIQKINAETEVKKLKARVSKLESLIKYGLTITSIIVAVITFFGWSAWSSITGT